MKVLKNTFIASRDTGMSCWDAEVHRLEVVLLLSLADCEGAEVEVCYNRGIEIARGQSARLFELRAAMDLARLWQEQGKLTEARDLLAQVFDWFTEGFGTADLKDAKALLEALA
ncbi:MAG: hypothetical protein VCB77_11750 [Alphaproteobacteria bacterium]